MGKTVLLLLRSMLLLVLIGTYGGALVSLQGMPTDPPPRRPTPTPVPGALNPDTGWSTLRPGLERRVIQIYNRQKQPVESLHIWRLDQDQFRLEVAFDGTPKSLQAWQKETGALLVVNGGYFSVANERYSPDGLTIVDGEVSGESFTGYGGMLAVRAGRAELRWLVEQPYDPDERLEAALQSFPVLVRPGGWLGFGADKEDHAPARRTVIAQDREGRILFIVAPQGYFTLHQLSAYLTRSDLDLDIALNLDGGGSTGLLVAQPREVIQPLVPLPFVILVQER